MAKTPQKPPSKPDDFPQVEPTELFPTNNIRFVIAETAKLIERVDALTRSSEKIGDRFDKALDKHSADMKERLTDLKADLKESTTKITDLKTSVDTFKGAMKVIGGLYALALVLIAAFLAWYLRPTPSPSSPPDLTHQTGTAQPANPAKNSN